MVLDPFDSRRLKQHIDSFQSMCYLRQNKIDAHIIIEHYRMINTLANHAKYVRMKS